MGGDDGREIREEMCGIIVVGGGVLVKQNDSIRCWCCYWY